LVDEALSHGTKSRKRPAKFLVSLVETLSPEDDGQWLRDLAEKPVGDGPFDDVGPAVKRLLEASTTLEDLGALAACSRYEACRHALRLLEESGLPDEEGIEGLHELLLSSDPSGKEGRPGSWPLVAVAGKRAGATAVAAEPLWKVRSGQAIAFSPDSKTLAVAGASGPVRIFDAATGKEQLACEGLKAHIYRIAFSPDGSQVAAAQINERLTVCDTSTGKLLAKARFRDDEVSGLAYSTRTGDLLRSSWTTEIDVIDPKSGKVKDPLRPADRVHFNNAISFFPDGGRLAAVWSVQDREHICTIWSWPERKQLTSFSIIEQLISDIAVSPDGKLLAIPFTTYHPTGDVDGILLADSSDGSTIRTIPMKGAQCVAFRAKDEVLITSDEDGRCHLMNPAGRELSRTDAYDLVYGLAVSPDGEFLAAATWRGAIVWRLPKLLQNCGSR
jgi:WD40 repeat protein